MKANIERQSQSAYKSVGAILNPISKGWRQIENDNVEKIKRQKQPFKSRPGN
jgi:hypothetical protein